MRPDYGIDLFVEMSENGGPTGRLLAVQVKSGTSYVGAGDGDIAFRADQKHIGYWLGHSLPVIVVLYDPEGERAYWQAVSEETAASTGKGWKLTIPRSQVLDEESLEPLAGLAMTRREEKSREAESLNLLRTDLTWMELLEAGGSVRLDAQEWINKTSGRGDVVLVAQPAGGGERIERHFVAFLGMRGYAEALPELLPWAHLHADEDLLDESDEDLWMEETGIWDSEDKCYIGNTEPLEEWRAGRFPAGALRPYRHVAGEVDLWRLWLTLNDLGQGVLALDATYPADQVLGASGAGACWPRRCCGRRSRARLWRSASPAPARHDAQPRLEVSREEVA